MKLQIKPLNSSVTKDNLFYATAGSAGIDLRANNDADIDIGNHKLTCSTYCSGSC